MKLLETGLSKEESAFIKECLTNGIGFDEDRTINELLTKSGEKKEWPENISEQCELENNLIESISELIEKLSDLTLFPPVHYYKTGRNYKIQIEIDSYCFGRGVDLQFKAQEID